ncbi:transmembrane protein 179-like [Dreissena polymorpha]|uniref:Uncharacterized protein n=1 Tax=Dreissena polymorpha TaxID=45954 RepID=A0A9D4QMS4_DREPO|nr:transmembrane protein 179-like [Dreissena polymorpha]KAH3835907.1 hypothetical protein DPMN_109275 [Dreissena polymorpha]
MDMMKVPTIPWRTIQITVNALTIVTGFCTFMPMAFTSHYFQSHCVLFAKVRISMMNSTSLVVDMTQTVWGQISDCRFPTYTPLVTSIHAFIWCWFFLLLREQLKKDQHELPLLMLSFLIHIVFFILMFIVACFLSAGVNTWCGNLVMEVTLNTDFHMFQCEDSQGLLWLNLFLELHPIYTFLLTAKISCWLQAFTLLCQTLACGYKLYKWLVDIQEEHFYIDRCGQAESFVTDSEISSCGSYNPLEKVLDIDR